MKFLLSSHALLGLVEIDADGRIADWSVLSRGYHYGVTADAQTALVYRGGEHGDAQTQPELLSLRLPAGTLESRRPLPDCADVHQILHGEEGLWITDTAHDRVVLQHPGADEQAVSLGPAPRDEIHVNSLHQAGRDLLLSNAEEQARESGVVKAPSTPIDVSAGEPAAKP